jgi:3-oxoacyl-(acyl-carrier-protein) synthase
MSNGSGGIVIGEGFRLVCDGYMDRLLVGGLDLTTDLNVISGMDGFGAVCSKYNSHPYKAMRLFD